MNHNNGRILLFNGASSSGKTSILNELHKIKPQYKILKVDDWFPEVLKAKATKFGWHENSTMDPWLYLHNYITKTTGNYYFDVELRKKLFNDSANLYCQAQSAATAGHTVIIDTVLEHEEEYGKFNSFFTNETSYKILVYCPMNIILQRVEKRNTSGIAQEKRTLFQSFEQFPALFKIQENPMEPVVDIIKSSTLKETLENSIHIVAKENQTDQYLSKLHDFKESFFKLFKLNEQQEIIIVPTTTYDVILNSSFSTPQESAEKVIEFLSANTLSK